MVFRKIRYNTGEGLFKVKIEDDSGAIIENWTIMFNDFPEWVNTICRKYGFKVDSRPQTDLDWAI